MTRTRIISFTKRCSYCGITKPITDFWANKYTKDGRQTVCKPCNNQMSCAAHRIKQQDEYDRLKVKIRKFAIRNQELEQKVLDNIDYQLWHYGPRRAQEAINQAWVRHPELRKQIKTKQALVDEIAGQKQINEECHGGPEITEYKVRL